MTFDELLQHLVNKDLDPQNDKFEKEVSDLMDEVIGSGENILSNYSSEKVAGLMTLAQGCAIRDALNRGDIAIVAFGSSDIGRDFLVYVFKAIVGLLAMEEIR